MHLDEQIELATEVAERAGTMLADLGDMDLAVVCELLADSFRDLANEAEQRARDDHSDWVAESAAEYREHN